MYNAYIIEQQRVKQQRLQSEENLRSSGKREKKRERLTKNHADRMSRFVKDMISKPVIINSESQKKEYMFISNTTKNKRSANNLVLLDQQSDGGIQNIGLNASPSRLSLISQSKMGSPQSVQHLSLKPPPMRFGANRHTQEERVLERMLDNQTRDPEVNLKSILGRDELVLNLRPTDKTKHIDKAYFSIKGIT